MDFGTPQTEEALQRRRLENRQLIEAALYLAGRPVQLNDLSQITGIDPSEISALIRDLQEKYRQFFSCFEIAELPGRKFVFQVKVEIGERVKEITPQPVLSLGELRTLAMIAYQQPVLQSTVVKVRGQQAYAHIKALLRSGFIKSVRVKQTLELRTTPMFSDYFGLSHDQGVLKRQLGWRTKRILKDRKMEETDIQAIEVLLEKIGLDIEDIEDTDMDEET